MITFLWAQTQDGVIGKNNKLPWNIPEEMNHFKNTTIGKTILMGSNTFESMSNKPLPNRNNIVLTRNKAKFDNLEYDNLFIEDSLESVLNEYKNGNKDLIVIGGRQIFDMFLPYCDKLIETIVKKPYKGDVYMSKINYNMYILVKQEEYDEFIIRYYERRGN